MAPDLKARINGHARDVGIGSLGGFIGALIPVLLWLMGVARASGALETKVEHDSKMLTEIASVQLPALQKQDADILKELNTHECEASARQQKLDDVAKQLEGLAGELKDLIKEQRIAMNRRAK